MKKKLGIVAVMGMGALALGLYWQSARAQADQGGGAAPRTRIALINLNEALKNYDKFKVLRETLKSKDQTFVQMLKAKQERVDTLRKDHADPKTTQKRRDEIEAEMRQINLEMENIRQQANKEIIRYQDEQLSQMFREVYQVVNDYAQKNGIDLVLQYNEEWNEDYNTPTRIVARMKLPFWPVYYDKNMDITALVVQTLNQRYAAAGGGGGVVPTGGNK